MDLSPKRLNLRAFQGMLVILEKEHGKVYKWGIFGGF